MDVAGQIDKLTGRFDAVLLSAETFRDQQILKAFMDAMLNGESDILIVRRGKLVEAFGFRNGKREED